MANQKDPLQPETKTLAQSNGQAPAPPNLPTPMEVSLIAATLARSIQGDWSEFVTAALNLWESSAAALEAKRKELVDPLHALHAELPTPKSFPVPLDKFLDLHFSSEAEDKDRLYRHFLMEWIFPDEAEPLIKAGELLGEHRAQPANVEDYYRRSFLFTTWFKRYKANKSSVSRRTKLLGPNKSKEEERFARERTRLLAGWEQRWISAYTHGPFLKRNRKPTSIAVMRQPMLRGGWVTVCEV